MMGSKYYLDAITCLQVDNTNHQRPSNLIFTQQEGEGCIEVRYEDGSIGLTQKLMAELFNVDVRTISEHLKNI